jgi:hypothetical protein
LKRRIEPSKDEIFLGNWKITADVLLLYSTWSISTIGKKSIEEKATPESATLELSS